MIQRLRVVASTPSPVTRVTLYPVFATRYAAADGCVRPIAKFLFADVEIDPASWQSVMTDLPSVYSIEVVAL